MKTKEGTIIPAISGGVYFKAEHNDDFFFRKARTITINAEALEQCDTVVINLKHRDVKISATKEEIKKHRDVKTFHGEVKFHYPIGMWNVVSGDANWVQKILSDFNL